jgi:hypothetical protein
MVCVRKDMQGDMALVKYGILHMTREQLAGCSRTFLVYL